VAGAPAGFGAVAAQGAPFGANPMPAAPFGAPTGLPSFLA